MNGWKDCTYSSVRLQTTGNTALRNHVNSSIISALRRGNLPALLLAEENGASNLANMSDTAGADVSCLRPFPTDSLFDFRVKDIYSSLSKAHPAVFFFSLRCLMPCRNCRPQAAKRKKARKRKKQNICAWQPKQDQNPSLLFYKTQ